MTKRTISLLILISFLFTSVASNSAFSQSLIYCQNSDKLAPPSVCDDMLGISELQANRMAKVEIALWGHLHDIGRGSNEIDVHRQLRCVDKAVFRADTEFQPEDAGMQFFFREMPAELKDRCCVRCDVKDKYGQETFYAVFFTKRQGEDGFSVHVYTKNEAENKYKNLKDEKSKMDALAKDLPSRGFEDAVMIKRYKANEMGPDAVIRYAHKKGLAKKPLPEIFDYKKKVLAIIDKLNLKISNPDPKNIIPIEKRELFLIPLKEEIDKMIGNVPLAEIILDDGTTVVKVCYWAHSSSNAVHVFVTEKDFAVLTERKPKLPNGDTPEDCLPKAIKSLLSKLAYEVGVMTNSKVLYTQERGVEIYPVNEMYLRWLNAPAEGQCEDELRVELANLDLNLRTRDYAMGEVVATANTEKIHRLIDIYSRLGSKTVRLDTLANDIKLSTDDILTAIKTAGMEAGNKPVNIKDETLIIGEIGSKENAPSEERRRFDMVRKALDGEDSDILIPVDYLMKVANLTEKGVQGVVKNYNDTNHPGIPLVAEGGIVSLEGMGEGLDPAKFPSSDVMRQEILGPILDVTAPQDKVVTDKATEAFKKFAITCLGTKLEPLQKFAKDKSVDNADKMTKDELIAALIMKFFKIRKEDILKITDKHGEGYEAVYLGVNEQGIIIRSSSGKTSSCPWKSLKILRTKPLASQQVGTKAAAVITTDKNEETALAPDVDIGLSSNDPKSVGAMASPDDTIKTVFEPIKPEDVRSSAPKFFIEAETPEAFTKRFKDAVPEYFRMGLNDLANIKGVWSVSEDAGIIIIQEFIEADFNLHKGDKIRITDDLKETTCVEIYKGVSQEGIITDKSCHRWSSLKCLENLSRPSESSEGPVAGTNRKVQLKDLAHHPLLNAFVYLAIGGSIKDNPYDTSRKNPFVWVTNYSGSTIFLFDINDPENNNFLGVFNKLALIEAQKNGRKKASLKDEITLVKKVVEIAEMEKDIVVNKDFVEEFKIRLKPQIEHFGVDNRNIYMMKMKKPLMMQVIRHSLLERRIHRSAITRTFRFRRYSIIGKVMDYKIWRKEPETTRNVVVKFRWPKDKGWHEVYINNEIMTYNEFVQRAHDIAESVFPLNIEDLSYHKIENNSGFEAPVAEISQPDAISREISEAIALADEAGKEIPFFDDTRYNLLVTEEFITKNELEKHKARYGDRFDLNSVSGITPQQFVYNVLSKSRDKENRTVVLVPDTLGQEQLNKLVQAGIRFIPVNAAELAFAKGMGDSNRMKFQLDTYAIMLLVRRIDASVATDSSLYKLLNFYIKSHFILSGTVTATDYINAIVNNNIAKLIKGILMYRPAQAYDKPDYGEVAATLLSA